MKKSIPGFSGGIKEGKINVPSGSVQKPAGSAPLVSNKGGKGGMPQGGTVPSKV